MTRRRVLVTMGVWVVVLLSLWVSDARPAVLIVGGIVAVAAAIIFAIGDLARTASRVRWTKRSQQPDTARTADRRVSDLRHHVYRAWVSGSTQINDTLVDLLDDRLLAHHNIDRTTDAATANHLLTPSLRRLVAGPRRQTATVRELSQILTDIEAL